MFTGVVTVDDEAFRGGFGIGVVRGLPGMPLRVMLPARAENGANWITNVLRARLRTMIYVR